MTTILQLNEENLGSVVNLNFLPAKVVQYNGKIIAIYSYGDQIAVVDKPLISDWFFNRGMLQYAQEHTLIEPTHPDYQGLLALLPSQRECYAVAKASKVLDYELV